MKKNSPYSCKPLEWMPTALMYVLQLVISIMTCILPGSCVSQSAVSPGGRPEVVYRLGDGERSLVQLPDGSFMLFKMDGQNLVSIVSRDGRTWTSPVKEIENNGGINSGLVILDKTGELQNIFSAVRNVPQKPGGPTGPGATKMIDLYHVKTIKNRTSWGKPQRIFEGYCGAFLDFKQLRNGRLIAPFAYWVAGQSPLPRGLNISTVVYSDDGGDTWTVADAGLTSPTYEGYPGNNYGAIEPAVVELAHIGHLYMLLRTNTGFLYESYSNDNGTTWTPAKPSRFHNFNSPALMKELPDKRIFMVWNNSDNIPKKNGKGIYGGRDAIHAAISDDYGETWKGFREIHRDPMRNETPPRLGDRGTAYANSAIGVDGKIMLITGMGKNRRHIVYVDPDWLTAKHHESDFANGLEEWSVFKLFGPVSSWWRDRVVGPELTDHPTKPGIKVLHVRRPDENDGDGAVWNFPNGRSGKLTVRIMLNQGFGGGSISLTDRFFNPTDSHGERLAPFRLSISPGGQLGADGPTLSEGKWYVLDLAWSLENKTCRIIKDGTPVLTLTMDHPVINGLSYLRLRSMASSVDKAGFLIESVVVDIDDNVAPAVSEEAVQMAAVDYRAKLSYEETVPEIFNTLKTNSKGTLNKNDSLVIVAFGNSITAARKNVDQVFAQRLPGLLAEEGINARVINSGLPGNHTGHRLDNNLHKGPHASDRFESDVLSHHPDVVIIGFGTNDSFIDSYKPDGPSRIPVDNYRDNLSRFIKTLQKKNCRVILIAPNSFGVKYESYHNDRLLQYVQVVRNLAKKYNTGLVDNYRNFNEYPAHKGGTVDSLLLDGLHPDDNGHKLIADHLRREILRMMVHFD